MPGILLERFTYFFLSLGQHVNRNVMPILKMGKVMPKVHGSAYRIQCYDLGSASPTSQTQRNFLISQPTPIRKVPLLITL